MRVLTVRQPWAWAIIHGGKNIENRSRNLAGNYRGPVAIHAALRADETGGRNELVRDAWARYGHGDWQEALISGAILGVVNLVSVHLPDPTGLTTCDCSPWAEYDTVHLEFTNPRAVENPIPYKGALGLRKLEPATVEQILKGLTK